MPLQQHPVPQEISSYEFRLVGDMTLKQFLQLAGGVGVAFLFFVTPIPAFVRWPLVTLAALGGAALAFLPIEERPLSHWIFSFVKAIYSPTVYAWQDGGSEDVYQQSSTVTVGDGIVSTQGEEKAQEYLSSIPKPSIVEPFQQHEKKFFSWVLDLFAQTTQIRTAPIQQQAFTENSSPVAVPPSQPVKVEPTPTSVPTTPPPNVTYTPQNVAPVMVNPSAQNNAAQAIFNLEASPPNPPTIPNTITGQVLTQDGRIVEGAILEIREVGGSPVRALRTNKVGHFLTVTSLKNGEYEIETEKDGLVFEAVKLQAIGEIIPPILIKAKG